MDKSEVWKRRREALAEFKKSGIKGWTPADGHCRFHHWYAKWCPACVAVREKLRASQSTPRFNVDLRPALAKCARLP